MRSNSIAFLGIVACTLWLAACSYTPLLRSKEYLLHNQTIKGNKAISKDELSPLYQQHPNRRFAALGMKTYLYFYLIGRVYLDTQKIESKIRKTHQKYQPLLAQASPDTLKAKILQDSMDRQLEILNARKRISADTLPIHEQMLQTKAKYEYEIDQVLSDTLERARIRKKYRKRLKKLETHRTEGNFMMRVMGEPPSLFDTNTVAQTRDQFINYYATKGYLFADISYKADTSSKNVSVVYTIKENPPLIIKDIVYEIHDTAVARVYRADSSHSFLKKGMVYSEELFNNERERTFKTLRDHGFYYFAKNYIFIDIDTAGHSHEATLFYIIRNPEQGSHKQYIVKDIIINIDKGKPSSKGLNTYVYNNKVYNMYYKKYSRKILNSKIPIQRGVYFNARQTQRTQNRLTQLQMFKFVNIAYTNVNDSLVATINAASLPKFQINDEFGVNTNVNRQIPGPYGSITFSNRNTFRGCEIIDLSLSAGIEGQISILDENQFIRTTEINGNGGITFPLLLLPGPLRYSYLDYNPRTRLSLSYISSYRPDYDRTEIRGIMNYQLQLSNTSRLIVAPLELNLINATIKDPRFEDQLKRLSATNGSNIIRNFQKSLISNMSVTYINNSSNPLINKRSHFFKTYVEIGGLSPTLIANWTQDQVIGEKELFGLPYYKFWKLGGDYRYYHPIYKKSTLAIRVSSNIITNINDNGNGIPYPKFLYTGGVNSIRAWRSRRLGPGSYVVKDKDGNFNYKIEQPGDLNFEGSIEGRFKVYKFFGIGLFADFGNVWTLKNDPERPGSKFELNSFYREIAVGTGIGLRLDFSFFVFRLDVSTKTYDPARPMQERFRPTRMTFEELLGKNDQTVVNFGIGYPF